MMIYRIRLSFTQKRGVLISVNVETLNILKSEIKEIKKLTNVNSVEMVKDKCKVFIRVRIIMIRSKYYPLNKKGFAINTIILTFYIYIQTIKTINPFFQYPSESPLNTLCIV